MKDNIYKRAMDEVKFSDDFSENTINAIKKKSAKDSVKRPVWKYVLGGMAACLAMALFAIPMLTNNNALPNESAGNPQSVESQKSAGEQSNPFGIVTAYAASPDNHQSAMVLPCAALMSSENEAAFPSANDAILPIITFSDNKVDSVAGVDLIVSGDEVESVTFSSKNYEIFYEDSRNWKTASGDLTWSEYNLFIEKEKISSENPTLADIIAVLEQMQFSNDAMERICIRQFVDLLYSQELSDIALNGGDVDEFLDEKMQRAIDFSKYEIEYTYEDFADKASVLDNIQPGYSVRIINPANPAVTPVTSKTVTVRSGEYVTWYLDGDTISELIGSEQTSLDLSSYSDEISVGVTYKNGESKTQLWQISFSNDGRIIVVSGSDITEA